MNEEIVKDLLEIKDVDSGIINSSVKLILKLNFEIKHKPRVIHNGQCIIFHWFVKSNSLSFMFIDENTVNCLKEYDWSKLASFFGPYDEHDPMYYIKKEEKEFNVDSDFEEIQNLIEWVQG